MPSIPDVDKRLLGDWETKPTMGQLGEVVLRYTFRGDATFTSAAELRSSDPPQVLRAKGTYRSEDGRIRFVATTNVGARTLRITSKYSFDGDDLVIVDRDGDTFVLERQSKD